MAELTKLESKLGEVIGLAMAAQTATKKVISLCGSDDQEHVPLLQRMQDEAAETESRSTDMASEIDGKKTAILEEARETKSKASEMLSTYLDADSDPLDGFEFLAMAEAGETGHWAVLRELAESAGEREMLGLAEWALPIQERHYDDVNSALVELAGAEDPNEPA